jgi:hypothetical protein
MVKVGLFAVLCIFTCALAPLSAAEVDLAKIARTIIKHQRRLSVSRVNWVIPVDLSKVDRTIIKQPVYQSKSPRYCLLVFGPKAKTYGWLVLDGDGLYVDRNHNDDLTESNDRHLVVDHERREVRIVAVGVKDRNRLLVGGEEVTL